MIKHIGCDFGSGKDKSVEIKVRLSCMPDATVIEKPRSIFVFPLNSKIKIEDDSELKKEMERYFWNNNNSINLCRSKK